MLTLGIDCRGILTPLTICSFCGNTNYRTTNDNTSPIEIARYIGEIRSSGKNM